jgi:tetratricopeptide (TPR) repeat protein
VQPLLEEAVAGLSADGRFDTAIMLLEFGGRSMQPLFDKIRNRRQARELFASCISKLPLTEQIERLVQVIELDPDYKEARKRLDGQLLAYIDRDLKQIQENVARGNLPKAVETFDRLLATRKTYQPFMNNQDNLNDYVQVSQKLVADMVSRHGADRTIYDKQAKLRFLEITNNSSKPKLIQLLEGISDLYLEKNRLTEATLALSQLVQLLETQASVESAPALLKSRRSLRDCYEKLELWDYSKILSEEISKTCPPKEMDAERQKVNAALAAWRDRPAFLNRHHHYLQELQLCRSGTAFYPCFAAFLDELIEREDKIFRYVG